MSVYLMHPGVHHPVWVPGPHLPWGTLVTSLLGDTSLLGGALPSLGHMAVPRPEPADRNRPEGGIGQHPPKLLACGTH